MTQPVSGKRYQFYLDMYKALMVANILQNATENQSLKWKKILQPIHYILDNITKILPRISVQWDDLQECERILVMLPSVSVDETTDSLDKCISHLIVGKLVPDKPFITYLLWSKTLEKVNSQSNAYFINKGLNILVE